MCWIPSHVNISGSERADIAAKSALSLPITGMKIPAEELIPGISKFCMNEWQDMWDCSHGNKLYSLCPKVGTVKHSKTLSRCDYVFIYRLRVGHCRLTHSYLLSGDNLPTCEFFGLSLTVVVVVVVCFTCDVMSAT